MKKILLITLFLVITIPLLADYNELVRNGIAAYKSRNWSQAVQLFKQAYQLQPSPKLKQYYMSAVKKGYTGNMSQGNDAYRGGNMNEAFSYYQAAYALYPNPKLKILINKVAMQPGVNYNPDVSFGGQPQEESPLKWVLIGADVVLAGLSVWLFMDQSSAADAYNELHTLKDSTTEENYDLLVEAKKEAEGKQMMFGIAAGLTVAAVAYTLVDMFALNILFPKSANAGYNFRENRYEVALNIDF